MGGVMTGSDRSDRLAEIKQRYKYSLADNSDPQWLVAALVAERALSDALVLCIHEGCHVDVLGEEMVAAAFKEHRRLRGLPEED